VLSLSDFGFMSFDRKRVPIDSEHCTNVNIVRKRHKQLCGFLQNFQTFFPVFFVLTSGVNVQQDEQCLGFQRRRLNQIDQFPKMLRLGKRFFVDVL